MFFGKPLLVPILLGALLAMLMAPVCRRLDTYGLHRAVSCALCVFMLLVVIAGILTLIVAEIKTFTEDIALLQYKTKLTLYHIQNFIEAKLNIAPEQQVSFAKEQVSNSSGQTGTLAGRILAGFTSTIATMVLMLVYTFLFLYSKEKYENFFVRLYHEEDTDKIRNVVDKISLVSQKYLTGRAISVMILTVLYSIALLIIGLKNAVLLAGIAALLTIIPYVGSTVGGMFPFVMAIITEDTIQPALLVALSIFMIQTIDNYFIEPNVVGGEVNLSAFASILSIIAGGILWGVAGMILFIPIIGIFKIICDHVEGLKPIAYVIGDAHDKKPSRLVTWIRERIPLNKTKKD